MTGNLERIQFCFELNLSYWWITLSWTHIKFLMWLIVTLSAQKNNITNIFYFGNWVPTIQIDTNIVKVIHIRGRSFFLFAEIKIRRKFLSKWNISFYDTRAYGIFIRGRYLIGFLSFPHKISKFHILSTHTERFPTFFKTTRKNILIRRRRTARTFQFSPLTISKACGTGIVFMSNRIHWMSISIYYEYSYNLRVLFSLGWLPNLWAYFELELLRGWFRHLYGFILILLSDHNFI